MSDLADERERMVAEQLEGRDIVDQRVLDAMGRVPREAFVDEEDRKRAYLDMPLRIGFGQTISQPYMVAIICQTAEVREGDRVLDIGTGSGYQAAVLAELGATVHTIERIPEGDGSLGLRDQAPFDAIVVAAAAPVMPASLYEQLVPRGRLVVPVGGPRGQRLEVIVRSPEGPAVTRSVPCRFVPLVGAEGF
jgi:protein-L-isoaspartate(D-aspartate) O-methyltransferase